MYRNARANDLKTGARYKDDATLWAQAIWDSEYLTQTELVNPFSDNLFSSRGNQVQRLYLSDPAQVDTSDMSLPKLAELFVVKHLHVSPTHPKFRDAKYLLEQRYKIKVNCQQTHSHHDRANAIASLVPAESRNQVKQQLHDLVSIGQTHQFMYAKNGTENFLRPFM
jgi:hypothetical protein